jgi:general stress protein 26
MDTNALKSDILNFLQNNTTGVIATVTPAYFAHSAAITFYVDTDMSIYFLTRKESKKFQNLSLNPSISLTAFEEKILPTSVHIDGTAEIMDSEVKKIEIKKILIERSWNESYLPPVMRQEGSEIVLIKITPKKATWFRFIKDSRKAELAHVDF